MSSVVKPIHSTFHRQPLYYIVSFTFGGITIRTAPWCSQHRSFSRVFCCMSLWASNSSCVFLLSPQKLFTTEGLLILCRFAALSPLHWTTIILRDCPFCPSVLQNISRPLGNDTPVAQFLDTNLNPNLDPSPELKEMKMEVFHEWNCVGSSLDKSRTMIHASHADVDVAVRWQWIRTIGRQIINVCELYPHIPFNTYGGRF